MCLYINKWFLKFIYCLKFFEIVFIVFFIKERKLNLKGKNIENLYIKVVINVLNIL